jgi:transglutaminase-like putative cysteine protease
MDYAIIHPTTYHYDTGVSVSYHLLHLEPRETGRQKRLDFSLEVKPAGALTVPRTDYYGNHTAFLAIETPHDELSVVARSRVSVAAPELPAPAATPAWESVREACALDVLNADTEAGEFLFDSPHIATNPDCAAYAAQSFSAGRPLLEGLCELTARIHRDFKFDPRATTIATPVTEIFRNRRGVCQDFAHLAISCLRSLGLPARYVSGYIETLPPPGQPRLTGADASHAWFAAWCPGQGWIDADPTNNLLCGDQHITVAWGRDFSDVSPLHGIVLGGGGHHLSVAVDVARIEP